MDRMTLPVVDGDASVERALAAMKKARARAIIVASEPVPMVCLNRDLVYAALYDVKRCAEVRGGHPVADVDVELPDDDVTRALDRAKRRFGMRATGKGVKTATLATRHETLRRTIETATMICRCKGDSTHLFDAPPEQPDSDCPLGDGSVLECF